ncbi:4Fe-4S binding protein [Geobacter pelophilus]|uniref:4Fe-4S binding protein n=1 Tax=Geoanaerobacter pelophilus TaxID=60036 RepID=A0AAW4KX21_9BACT|nr:mercury methylation ferredoxin HgcB [Geoanaerobacter pelophilus]MBT0662864.1 4Fe-4S binding protein [Geoanaerobacter pelophilus]
MKGFRYLSSVVTLELDQAACIGCGRCQEVCPHQVFAVTAKKAVMQDRDACMECGACALNCPVKAIKVDAGVGCASGMIHEWLREHKLEKLAGDCCS